MEELKGELIVFLVAVITGGIVRLVYQCIGCFRQMVRHSLFAVGAEDVIFWVSAALYVFVQICSNMIKKLKKMTKKDLH